MITSGGEGGGGRRTAPRRWVTGVLLVVGTGMAVPGAAQRPDAPAPSPVIGLALSGGAARGLAHIGVIQVLEEAGIPVDLVSGTSMGSLVGGLYAVGLPADSLEAVARRFNAENLFSDQIPRRLLTPDARLFDERTLLSLPLRDGAVQLPGGALEGLSVVRALERELWGAGGIPSFADLPRPFVAVATDLRSGEAVTLREGGLAEAIRASIAIPGLLTPVDRVGRTLVDGGVVRNLPAPDVKELGADLVICSDVARPLEELEFTSLVDVISRTMMVDTREEIARQRGACDLLIRPVSVELSAQDFDELDYWLALGRRAAEAALPELRRALSLAATELGAEGGVLPADRSRGFQARRARLLPDSVRVARIRFSGGLSSEMEGPARRALGFREGEYLNAARMDRALAALAASELYASVGYELERTLGGVIVDFRLPPVRRDRIGVGLRYDDRYQASLLVSARLQSRLGYGSSTRFDARLGEELQLQVTHLRGRGITSRLSPGFSAGFTRVPLRLARSGRTLEAVETEQLHLSALLAAVDLWGNSVALELRGERVTEDDELGAGVPTRNRRYLTGGVRLWRDTFDDPAFPRRGTYLLVRGEWAEEELGSGAQFSQRLVDARAAVPVSSRLSLRAQLYGGVASGPDLPLHKHFFLGGTITSSLLDYGHPGLLGLSTQSEWGRAAQMALLGFQFEVRPDWFLVGVVNAGDTQELWDVRWEGWQRGWGVTVGTRSALGPVVVTLAGWDRMDDLRLDFQFGRLF